MASSSGDAVPAAGLRPARGPLPLLMWAYPQEFKSAAAASQVRARRTASRGPLGLRTASCSRRATRSWTTRRCRSWARATRSPTTPTSSSSWPARRRPWTRSWRWGVADRDRIAIGGHSYGAFMTANLLAHTRPVPAGHRAQRRLQPHAHAVRVPGRRAHLLEGPRQLHADVAVQLRRPDPGAAC